MDTGSHRRAPGRTSLSFHNLRGWEQIVEKMETISAILDNLRPVVPLSNPRHTGLLDNGGALPWCSVSSTKKKAGCSHTMSLDMELVEERL